MCISRKVLGKLFPAARNNENQEENAMKQQKSMGASGLMMGLAAGAAAGMAGMYWASQNKREVKRAAKKLARGAENAVQKMDRMMTDLSARM